jgi:hypothetical protein
MEESLESLVKKAQQGKPYVGGSANTSAKGSDIGKPMILKHSHDDGVIGAPAILNEDCNHIHTSDDID